MKRNAAFCVVVGLLLGALGASPALANDILVSRTDGPWTYKYGIADTDGLILQEVKYNGKFVFGKFSLTQIADARTLRLVRRGRVAESHCRERRVLVEEPQSRVKWSGP